MFYPWTVIILVVCDEWYGHGP